MKKYILILGGIIIIIIAFMVMLSFNTKTIRKDLYTIVFFNDTCDNVKSISVNIQDISQNKFVYATENDISPGEYRKININIYDQRLRNLNGSYNVFVDCRINEHESTNSSAGYFTSEYGGFEVITLKKVSDNYFMAFTNTEADRFYKKLKRRHIKNPEEYSWN